MKNIKNFIQICINLIYWIAMMPQLGEHGKARAEISSGGVNYEFEFLFHE